MPAEFFYLTRNFFAAKVINQLDYEFPVFSKHSSLFQQPLLLLLLSV